MIDQYLKPNVKRGAIYYAVIGIVLGILMAIPLLNCIVAPLACLVGFVLPFATGYFVAQWGTTMPARSTPLAVTSSSPYATPAVDGGVATAVGALISGIVNWIISIAFGAAFAAMGAAGSPGDTGAALTGVAIGGAAGVVGIVFGVIIAAVLGAVGGLLYVALSGRRATAA